MSNEYPFVFPESVLCNRFTPWMKERSVDGVDRHESSFVGNSATNRYVVEREVLRPPN